MTNEPRQVNGTARFRLESGLDVLDEWAQNASQSKKNALYKALFAMQDGSLFHTYRVIDDFQRANELYVVVRDDLVIKIRINGLDVFDIVSIGSVADATNLTGRRRSA